MQEKISKKTIKEIKYLYGIQKAIGAVNINEIARRADVPFRYAFLYTKLADKGIESFTEYHEYLVKKSGFKSFSDYKTHLAKKSGFKSYTDYQKYLVRERGKGYDADHEKYLAKQRQKKPENKKLSEILKESLLGRTQRKVAKELGVNESAVSRYVHGWTTPRKSLQKKLFKILQLPYKTIDDILDK